MLEQNNIPNITFMYSSTYFTYFNFSHIFSHVHINLKKVYLCFISQKSHKVCISKMKESFTWSLKRGNFVFQFVVGFLSLGSVDTEVQMMLHVGCSSVGWLAEPMIFTERLPTMCQLQLSVAYDNQKCLKMVPSVHRVQNCAWEKTQ